MTNDKDSAVLADKSDEYAIGHLSALLEVELHENGHTIGEDLAEKLAEIAVKTVRQPTQSDAVLDGDALPILYLLGVKHGQEDERAKIAAEASQPTQSDALREALEKVITSSNLEKAHEIAATTLEELRQPTQSDDDAYELGKRDGYESAVQDIDMLTGGDGEYRYSTIGGERHCPDADSMKARIAERFNSQPTQSDAVREAVIEECANALEADAMKCDCAALEERECGCGAWCEWKSITSARAIEIVRALKGETK